MANSNSALENYWLPSDWTNSSSRALFPSGGIEKLSEGQRWNEFQNIFRGKVVVVVHSPEEEYIGKSDTIHSIWVPLAYGSQGLYLQRYLGWKETKGKPAKTRATSLSIGTKKTGDVAFISYDSDITDVFFIVRDISDVRIRDRDGLMSLTPNERTRTSLSLVEVEGALIHVSPTNDRMLYEELQRAIPLLHPGMMGKRVGPKGADGRYPVEVVSVAGVPASGTFYLTEMEAMVGHVLTFSTKKVPIDDPILKYIGQDLWGMKTASKYSEFETFASGQNYANAMFGKGRIYAAVFGLNHNGTDLSDAVRAEYASLGFAAGDSVPKKKLEHLFRITFPAVSTPQGGGGGRRRQSAGLSSSIFRRRRHNSASHTNTFHWRNHTLGHIPKRQRRMATSSRQEEEDERRSGSYEGT